MFLHLFVVMKNKNIKVLMIISPGPWYKVNIYIDFCIFYKKHDLQLYII